MAFPTYKYYIGAILLALYVFVATPVQVWHHHNAAHAAKQNSAHDILTQADGNQQDANCPVCSHKYSGYNDVAIVAFELSITITPVKNGLYQLSAVAAPAFSLPNKGPPSIS
jgi:hypothetical protein